MALEVRGRVIVGQQHGSPAAGGGPLISRNDRDHRDDGDGHPIGEKREEASSSWCDLEDIDDDLDDERDPSSSSPWWDASEGGRVSGGPEDRDDSDAAEALWGCSGSGRTLRNGKYAVISLVGHGTFGEVLKCEETPEAGDGDARGGGRRLVAVKRVFLQKTVRSKETCYANTLEHAAREAETLRSVRCANVLRIYDQWEDEHVLSMALEYCVADLRHLLDKHPEVVRAPAMGKRIMRDLLAGLSAIHAKGIIHRDIKPSNCLVSSEGIVKLGDFGQATFAETYRREGSLTHAVSTRWYRAPELLYGSRTYSSSVDVWSLGCTIAELVLPHPLVCGESDIDQMAKVFRCFGTPTEESWPGVGALPDHGKIIFDVFEARPFASVFPGASAAMLDFFSGFFHLDPAKRSTAEDLLAHPFFEEDPPPCPAEDLGRALLHLKLEDLRVKSNANN